MATCYLCGRSIPPDTHQFRRTVKTGERTQRVYSRATPEKVTTSFGKRIVCGRCARTLDIERRWKDLLQYIELALALLLLLIALLTHLL